MSKETLQWLNTNTLIGNTDKRGTAWHYRAEEQGERSNHYPGFIPVEDVEERLFGWDIITRPSFTTAPCELDEATGIDGEGLPYKLILVEGEQRMMRSDTHLVMGPAFKAGYRTHQYREWLLRNVSTILDDDLGVTSAGLLRGGAVAWVEVSIPDTITTPQGVEFRPNLLACTSCDASIATGYAATNTNVVCDNTMGTARAEKGRKIKYKHTANSLSKAGEAREAVGIVHNIADDYMAQLDYLESIKVTATRYSKFVDKFVLTDSTGKVKEWKDLQGRSKTMAVNKADTLHRLYKHDLRVAPWAGTAIGVVQAVNTFTHHEGIVRGAERAERNMLSAVEGKFDTLDSKTLDMLLSV